MKPGFARSPSQLQSETICVIDGYSQFFRAYYARRPYQSSSVTKEPTKLVAGFLDILMHLLEARKPDYLVVALDVSRIPGHFALRSIPNTR